MKRLLKIGKWFLGTLVSFVLVVSLLLAIFKDDIINYAIKEINKHLAAKVHVSSIELRFWTTFPKVSLDFNDVFISDSYPNATVQDTLLYTDKIRLRFNAMDIWNKKYKVESIAVSPGTIQIKENEEGVGNYFVLKEKDSSASTSDFKLDLNKITFDKVRFSYESKLSDLAVQVFLEETKLNGQFNNEITSLSSQFIGNISSVKQGQIELIKNKKAAFSSTIIVNQLTEEFNLQPTTLYIEDLPFHLKAHVDSSQYTFSVNAEDLKVQDLLNKIYAQKEAKKMQSRGELFFNLDVNGNSKKSSIPEIICDFGIKKGSAVEPTQGLNISNINFKGSYRSNSKKGKEELFIPAFSFDSKYGPFSGNIRIREFQRPHVNGSIVGTMDLASISRFFALESVEEISGMFTAKAEYDFCVVPKFVGNSIDVKSLKGSVSCDNVAFQLKDDSRKFKQVSASFLLANNNAAIEYLNAKVNSSDFKIKGEFTDLIPYLKDKAKLNANLTLQAQRIVTSDLINTVEHTGNSIEAQRSFVLPDDIDAIIVSKIDELEWDQKSFKSFETRLNLSDRKIDIKNFKLNHASTTFQGSIDILERYPEQLDFDVKTQTSDLNLKSLFSVWNNFDQSVITSSNINGKAAIQAELSFPIDLRTDFNIDLLKAKIGLLISNGRVHDVTLLNELVESLKSSKARFVFKPKELRELEDKLKDIRFSTLQNTLLFENGKLDIPFMEIVSSAVNLDFFGWQHHNGSMEYHLAFKLRELLVSEEMTEFGIVEPDGSGIKLFAKIYGTIEKPKFEWDFNQAKKQAKQQREEAKKEALSILKTEFGFRKGDTTIATYQKPVEKPKEILILDFSGKKQEDPVEVPKKDSELKKKIQQKIDKMKKESEKEVEIEWEYGIVRMKKSAKMKMRSRVYNS